MSSKPVIPLESPINRVVNLPISLPAAILTSVITIYVALRLWHMTAYSLWGGEAFTMIGAKQGWNGMFSYIIADIVHPPLFYVLLKFWILL
jgi:hypothetical protein